MQHFCNFTLISWTASETMQNIGWIKVIVTNIQKRVWLKMHNFTAREIHFTRFNYVSICSFFLFFFWWWYNWNALKAGLALFIFIPVSLNDGLNAADIRNINPQGLKDYIKTGFTYVKQAVTFCVLLEYIIHVIHWIHKSFSLLYVINP